MKRLEKVLAQELRAAASERSSGLAASDFDELVPAHQGRIYRVLRSITRDSDLAETLTQECFVRAYKSRRDFRGDASIETWLLRIAVNLATDHRRSRRKSFWSRMRVWDRFPDEDRDRPRDTPTESRSAEEALIAGESAREVWAAAEELSPQQRAVFVLRFGEEMTIEEIAATAGIEVGTVKAHLYRAISAVRRRLGEQVE